MEDSNEPNQILIGGRQSAFEWAALISEEGAAEVHIASRHPTPEFAKSEWGWINSVLDVLPDHPGWFRDLSSEQRASLSNTMRRDGRLKLEPSLADRINRKEITLHPNTEVSNCTTLPSGDLSISLANGALLNADHVILETGFNPDIRAINGVDLKVSLSLVFGPWQIAVGTALRDATRVLRHIQVHDR